MSEEKKAADDLIAISEDLGLYEEPECWIVIEQGKLMTLIRCAMFRDSFLGDRDDFGDVFSQLTTENKKLLREWEEKAP